MKHLNAQVKEPTGFGWLEYCQNYWSTDSFQ